jgi:hypothetical protein
MYCGDAMKLNGWMRLWIVFSASWVVLTGYLAYTDISPIYTKKTYRVSKKKIGNVDFIFSAAQPDIEVNNQIAIELIPLVEKTPKDYVNKVISTPYEKYLEKHASVEIWKCITLTLLPVFGLLIIGWSFVWVWRGFRGNTNT